MVIFASSLIDWFCPVCCVCGVVAVVSEPRYGADDQLSDAGTTVAGAGAAVALRLIRS
ncbi:hypothetical protein GCM10010330_51910 [Streptomyces tendae]|nr:hypothetical protein GCM10010330_51910 [Streptomyces tendae]